MYVPAIKEDIPEIVAVINRAYRGHTGSGWNTESAYLEGDRTSEALLRDDLMRKPRASLLKWEDRSGERIAGCVWLEPVSNSTWYLGLLAIDPRCQNGGFGRILLEAAENWALGHGAKRMRMSVINVRESLIA